MSPEERRNKIITLLDEKKFITVHTLVTQLFSSEATIRRDLTFLEKEGYLKRTAGGALSIKEYYREQPFDFKSKTHMEQKKYIAGLAMDFISSYQTIFMDSSSTCTYLARRMTSLDNLTILCNGLPTCELLSANETNTVYSPGGTVLARNGSVIGSDTARFIEKHYADIAFMSCRGLDAGFGASDFVEEIINIKKSFRRNSTQVVLLLDSSKFGKKFFFQSLSLAEIDVVISDTRPPADIQAALDANNIEMIY